MDFEERQRALEVLFTRDEQSDPMDRYGIAHWMRSIVLHVQEWCAKRAEYGDFETGMDCADGYTHDSDTAVARKEAADDIRTLRFGPDYVDQ